MITLRKPRPEFDPANDFVVAKKLIVTNTMFEPDPTRKFDKGLITGRLLRQLYEQNYLDVADPEKLSAAPGERKRRRRFSDGGAS